METFRPVVTNEKEVESGAGLLPEEVEWPDEGCALFPSCLNCPLPRCVEEEPRRAQRAKRADRARRMAGLRRAGKTVEQIAQLCGVSRRTVQRALAFFKATGGVPEG